jgi:hypothetical protein
MEMVSRGRDGDVERQRQQWIECKSIVATAVTWRMCYMGMEWLFDKRQHVIADLMKQARVNNECSVLARTYKRMVEDEGTSLLARSHSLEADVASSVNRGRRSLVESRLLSSSQQPRPNSATRHLPAAQAESLLSTSTSPVHF